MELLQQVTRREVAGVNLKVKSLHRDLMYKIRTGYRYAAGGEAEALCDSAAMNKLQTAVLQHFSRDVVVVKKGQDNAREFFRTCSATLWNDQSYCRCAVGTILARSTARPVIGLGSVNTDKR